MYKWILVVLGAAFVGGAIVFFWTGDVDLMSTPKNEIVVLREDLVVQNAQGVEVRFPAGATLNFDSQYFDEASLRVRIVTTKLDAFAPAPSGAQAVYYAD